MVITNLLLAGCSVHITPTSITAVMDQESIFPPEVSLAIINGTILDGNGGEPIADGVVLIHNEKIVAIGSSEEIKIPVKVDVLDASGGFILPGFINTHIHGGYNPELLHQMLLKGITTVRDEGARSSRELAEWLLIRDEVNGKPEYAHLVSAGFMIGSPGGYGDLFVDSPTRAEQAVVDELHAGADQIKVCLEDGYAGKHDLPKLSADELRIIIQTAHDHGGRVSGHITQAAYIPLMLDAGVDDIAHLAWDPIPEETLVRMVSEGVYLIPTFTVFRNYDAPMDQCVDNLRRFIQAGGMVALGNDFGGGPGNFEVGIPMYEIKMMQQAGMTPMQIIQAGTSNAAIVIGMGDSVGTLETGKIADILIVNGQVMDDINSISDISAVIHLGKVVHLGLDNE